jgi:membrane protein
MPIFETMLKKITTYITELPPIVRLVDWSKATSLPGFQGVPVHSVVIFLYNEIFKNPMLMTRANAMAFSFFMSLFPSMIVLLSLIPFLPFKRKFIDEQLTFAIKGIMPNKTGTELLENIIFFLQNPRKDFLSIGFILAIYFASNGLMSLMKNFERNHQVFLKRTLIQKRMTAVGMTFTLGLLFVLSFTLVILGNQLIHLLVVFLKLTKSTEKNLLQPIRWISVLGLVYFGVAMVYRYGILMKRKMNLFSPGASTATLLSLLSSVVFSYYVDKFGNYNKVYGSFVAGIVLLLWLQLNAIILIVGFELNAAIAVNRDLLTPLVEVKKEEDVPESNEEKKDDFENVF